MVDLESPRGKAQRGERWKIFSDSVKHAFRGAWEIATADTGKQKISMIDLLASTDVTGFWISVQRARDTYQRHHAHAPRRVAPHVTRFPDGYRPDSNTIIEAENTKID